MEIAVLRSYGTGKARAEIAVLRSYGTGKARAEIAVLRSYGTGKPRAEVAVLRSYGTGKPRTNTQQSADESPVLNPCITATSSHDRTVRVLASN